ncbi:17294_t:CDS:2, partial [Funneliformis caledonium]
MSENKGKGKITKPLENIFAEKKKKKESDVEEIEPVLDSSETSTFYNLD